MRLIRKITAILRNTSGVSLMFVLGIMLMLLALGASVMAAASTNVGAYVRQNEYNRIRVLSDSIHRSLMFALLEEPDEEDHMKSLSCQIAMLIYDEFIESGDSDIADIDLEIDIATPGNIKHSITLSFIFRDVDWEGSTPFSPKIPADELNNTQEVPEELRIPAKATITARVAITVVVETDRIVSGSGIREVTTRAVYNYEGALTDDPLDEYSDVPEEDIDKPLDMLFAPGEYGTWSLVSYDIVES